MKAALVAVLTPFVLTRLMVFTVAGAAVLYGRIDPVEARGFHLPPQPHVVLESWARYDACWLITIAEHGYRGAIGGSEDMRAAFFPLFPWLVATVIPLLRVPVLAGLIVSNASLLVFLCLLWQLVQMDWGAGVAQRTTWVYLMFPSAFFLSGAYSESLLLMLTAGAMLMARRRRWLLAGVLAGLATLDRSIGIVSVVPLIIECASTGREGDPDHVLVRMAKVGAPVVAAAVAYIAFAWWAFGNPLAHVEMETAVRGTVTGPWQPFIDMWKDGVRWHAFNNSLFDATLAVIAVATLPAIFANVRPSYGAYALLVVMIPLSSSLMSFNRLLLASFPHAILLARHIDRPGSAAAVLIPLGVLEAILTAAFATWHWVA